MRYTEAMRAFPLFVLVLLATAAAGTARADTTYIAVLDGLQNSPPLPQVTATGNATLVLNEAGTELSFTVTYQGLSSAEIGAHIHNARPGLNGPIAFTLPMGTPKAGIWQIPPDMVVELQAGRLYINVHTDTYSTGEIRGNIVIPVPVKSETIGSLKHIYR
jgi:hypothetical protein